jgi:hypothetical protein
MAKIIRHVVDFNNDGLQAGEPRAPVHPDKLCLAHKTSGYPSDQVV